MDLIRTNFKEAQRILSKIEVRRKIGNCYPEDLQYILIDAPEAFDITPEEAELSPIEEEVGLIRLRSIDFYGSDESQLNLKYLTRSIRTELNENFSMPLDISLKQSYLSDILKLYSDIESQIVQDEVLKFKYDNLKLVDLKIEKLNKMERDLYSFHLESIKKTLRNEIRYLKDLESDLQKQSLIINQNKKGTPISNPIPKEDLIQGENDGVIIRSFFWKRQESFERDILFLFELLKDSDFIPKNTDFKYFTYAFSGKLLVESLRIKWLITGKNKQTSKSSLFHFISRLEDYKLIENKDWSGKNYMPLYRKIAVIFTDKDDKIFSIEGLKSSRSQGIHSDCAKQTEINDLIKRIANTTTAKQTE
jgi:hypothetical protein